MGSIAAIGMAGIARGIKNAAQHVEQVNQAFQGAGATDPVQPLVELHRDALQVEASSKLVQVAATMTQTVLDLFA
ncbi:MAG: hypothetical protein EBZ48_12080 [Proteobacteria bacterium]|nr:hypothetical protein [Pseudomonadota bacterium]